MAKQQKKEKLLILDVSSLVYRAYHALPEFTTAHGEASGALYGFIAMVLKAIKERKPTHLVGAVDLPGKTFRHATYREYKATRPSTPPELIAQLEKSREILSALAVPVLGAAGFEADDVIATVTERAHREKKQMHVEIVSGDADVLQLVDDHTIVLAPKRGLGDLGVLTREAVQRKLGVGPALVPAYKALRGDPSDNIPGVRGIGEKSAAALLQEAGSLEALLEQVKSKEKGSKTLERFKDTIVRNSAAILQDRELVTLRKDSPVRFTFDDARMKDINSPAFVAILKRFGFESLLRRVGKAEGVRTLAHGDDLERFIAGQEAETQKEINAAEKTGTFSKDIAALERALVSVISAMERYGILVDQDALKTLSHRFHAQRTEAEETIFRFAGKKFNIASPKQLGDVLFSHLQILPRGKTSGGRPSTAASVLDTLTDTHPIVSYVLRWRELQKLLTTYVETLPHLVDKEDGRIHAKFWQLGTATGRIASSDPNLQNIPGRGEDGRAVRNAFISPKGSLLLAADYSQIELRVAAILSRDDAMLQVFQRGEDIHTATAERLFPQGSADERAEHRRRAKVLNFGILYGMGPRRVSREIGVSVEEAQLFLDEYFAMYPKLSQWLSETRDAVRRDGYTVTAFGRKRLFPEIHSRNHAVVSQAERAAVNAPIQGTEADLVKRGMVALKTQMPELAMVVTVHDEIVFEIPEKDLIHAASKVQSILEAVWPEAPTAFPVTLAVGKQWGTLTPMPRAEVDARAHRTVQ